jgi:hypothetical protein
MWRRDRVRCLCACLDKMVVVLQVVACTMCGGEALRTAEGPRHNHRSTTTAFGSYRVSLLST